MKSLKVLLIAATIASANVALAQENAATKQAPTDQAVKKTYMTPEEHATKQTEKLTSICALSADQQTEVKTIYLESDYAMQASNKAAGKDNAKAEADYKKLIEERKQKLEAVLTPDQRKKFEEAIKANNGKSNDKDEK